MTSCVSHKYRYIERKLNATPGACHETRFSQASKLLNFSSFSAFFVHEQLRPGYAADVS
jgi:hypothetical protein